MGSYPDGRGRWGHNDLAGGMWEWTLDWYDADYYDTDCENCANLVPSGSRVARCGAWDVGATNLRAVDRFWAGPMETKRWIGFRCARTP